MPKITRIINGKIVDIDESNRTWQQGNQSSAEYYRREQKTKFRRELTQRVEPREYIKAYGVQGARDKGFTDEQIRKHE